MFPCDVLRLISLRLEPYALVINKQLLDMYNDIWFHDKLQLLHPGLTLYTSSNYYNLYQKYQKQGYVYEYHDGCDGSFLKLKGVKATHMFHKYILTFNGDLYCEIIKDLHPEIDDDTKLIDTCVIDVDKGTYIKEYDWYLMHSKSPERIKLTPETKFIKVIYTTDGSFALSSDGIYNYKFDNKSLQFYRINGSKDMYFADTGPPSNLIIVDDNNQTHTLRTFPELREIPNDDNIIYKPNIGLFDKYGNPFYPNIVTKLSLPRFVKTQKHDHYNSRIVILANNKAHIYSIFDDIDNYSIPKLKTTIPNVYNIFSDWGNWYFIVRNQSLI